MTQPIDEVYVDLHARGEEKAADDIADAARNMQRYIDNAMRDIERSIKRTAKDLATSMEVGAESAERSIDDLADSATRDLRRIDREMDGVGDGVRRNFGAQSKALISDFVERLSVMGAHLRNISAIVPPPILLLLAALVPPALALGGALADLSALALLLPAALGALVASVAALKLAFSGVGDAVSALASGDLEKINEAMSKLAPSAQAFAREIHNLREPLQQLKKDVQEAFFAPLQGALTRLVNAALPTLRSGLSDVAGAFGELGRQLFDLVGSQDILEAIGDVFQGTANIIRNISPELIDLLGTLFGVAERGMPFLERAFLALGRGMESLDKFLEGSLQSGSFETFLNDAFQIMSDLGDLTKAVFNLLGALFGDLGDEGSSLLQTLTDLTNQLADFFNSARGQELIQGLVDQVPVVLALLKALVVTFLALVIASQEATQAITAFGTWVFNVGVAVVDWFRGLDDAAKSAWGGVTDAASAIGDFFQGVGAWVADAWGSVTMFFTNLFRWFTELPGRVTGAVTALPGVIVSVFTQIFDFVTYTLGYVIGSVIQFFIDLPGRIQTALMVLLGIVVFILTDVRDRMIGFVLTAVDTVVEFFTSLPERAGAALDFLVERVSSIFTRTRDSAINRVRSMFDSVVGFFQRMGPRIMEFINTLPGRVVSVFQSLRDRMFGIGRGILDGIISGIRNGLSNAVEWAKRAANNILRGMKDALGMASPSRVAAAQVGRPLMEGVGVGAVDAIPDVRSTINRAISNVLPGVTNVTNSTDSGQSVVFADGAIQVVFQGAVPTDDEALRTGQAVGRGIAQTIARHNVRTAVRIA